MRDPVSEGSKIPFMYNDCEEDLGVIAGALLQESMKNSSTLEFKLTTSSVYEDNSSKVAYISMISGMIGSSKYVSDIDKD